jgi:membrane-bound inhibitor of C-type lysozyme
MNWSFLAVTAVAIGFSAPSFVRAQTTPAPTEPMPAPSAPTPDRIETAPPRIETAPTPARTETAPTRTETAPTRAQTSDLITYRCDNNKGFTAVYTIGEANNSVRLTFGTKVITLPQIESASGARYSDGSVTLFTKGDEAFVTVGDNRLFVNCVASGGIQGLW